MPIVRLLEPFETRTTKLMKTIYFTNGYRDSKVSVIEKTLREQSIQAGFSVVTPSNLKGEVHSDATSSLLEVIKRASLVIAVIEDPYSSVFLELGYAIGMGKPVVIVADLTGNLPFDLSNIRAIDLRIQADEIATRLLKVINELKPKVQLNSSDFPNQLIEMLHLRSDFPEKFEQIPYVVFEEAVQKEFFRQGFAVEIARPGADFGFDFRVLCKEKSFLVEVKKSSVNSKVSIEAVQQLLGAIHAYNVPIGLLIGASEFTDSARGFAKRHAKDLELWSPIELLEFAEEKRKI
jgi:HJR/Mrr/RecB family endonuclease